MKKFPTLLSFIISITMLMILSCNVVIENPQDVDNPPPFNEDQLVCPSSKDLPSLYSGLTQLSTYNDFSFISVKFPNLIPIPKYSEDKNLLKTPQLQMNWKPKGYSYSQTLRTYPQKEVDGLNALCSHYNQIENESNTNRVGAIIFKADSSKKNCYADVYDCITQQILSYVKKPSSEIQSCPTDKELIASLDGKDTKVLSRSFGYVFISSKDNHPDLTVPSQTFYPYYNNDNIDFKSQLITQCSMLKNSSLDEKIYAVGFKQDGSTCYRNVFDCSSKETVTTSSQKTVFKFKDFVKPECQNDLVVYKPVKDQLIISFHTPITSCIEDKLVSDMIYYSDDNLVKMKDINDKINQEHTQATTTSTLSSKLIDEMLTDMFIRIDDVTPDVNDAIDLLNYDVKERILFSNALVIDSEPLHIDNEYLTSEELSRMSFSRLSVILSKLDTNSPINSNKTKFIFKLAKIGGKKVPESFANEHLVYYDLQNNTLNSPGYTHRYFSICPADESVDVEFNLQILDGSKLISNSKYRVIGAKYPLSNPRTIDIGISDLPTTKPAFHNINNVIISLRCQSNSKINIVDFPCWDRTISTDSQLRRCWKTTENSPSCPNNNIYTNNEYLARCIDE